MPSLLIMRSDHLTNVLSIDVQRSGFPVKVAGVELWFDTSLENIQKFLSVEQLAQEKLVAAQEVAAGIELPDELSAETMDGATAEAAMFVHREFVKALYDITFGDGSFDKIYEVVPDVVALEDTYNVLGVAVAQRMGEMQEERGKVTQDKIQKYLKKKKAKK